MRMAKALLNPNDHRTCYRDWVKFNEECSKECIRENTHFCEHHTVNDTGPNTYFSSTLLIQNFLFTDMTYRNILFTRNCVGKLFR